MSYIPDIDQSAYLKFFDKITNEWKDDIHTDNPDIMIETRTIDPRKKNKRGGSSSRDLFLADSGAQVSMVNYSLVRNLGVNPVYLPETIINVRGISGKGFERNSKLIYLEIKYNNQSSLERVLVQEDCGNILSYNTLQRL